MVMLVVLIRLLVVKRGHGGCGNGSHGGDKMVVSNGMKVYRSLRPQRKHWGEKERER